MSYILAYFQLPNEGNVTVNEIAPRIIMDSSHKSDARFIISYIKRYVDTTNEPTVYSVVMICGWHI